MIILSQREEKQFDNSEQKSIPWKSVLTSKPVWAVAAGHLARN